MNTSLLISVLLIGPLMDGAESTIAKETRSAGHSVSKVVSLRLTKSKLGKDHQPASRDELRTFYKQMLQATSRKKQPSPYEYTTPLVALHKAIAGCDQMSRIEKKRLHTSLEARLKQMQTILQRDLRRGFKPPHRANENGSKDENENSSATATAGSKPKNSPAKTAKSNTDESADTSKSKNATQTKASRTASSSRRTSQSNTRSNKRPTKASFAGPAEIQNAQDLIALIKSTIDPDSWDINGGKGTAMFYSPLNVLVIRNTAEVHGNIGSTLRP